MVTGSTQGHLAIWDLEQMILLQQHRHAHNGAVTVMKSMLSEPLLVTSSLDNTLKVISRKCVLVKLIYIDLLYSDVDIRPVGWWDAFIA